MKNPYIDNYGYMEKPTLISNGLDEEKIISIESQEQKLNEMK